MKSLIIEYALRGILVMALLADFIAVAVIAAIMAENLFFGISLIIIQAILSMLVFYPLICQIRKYSIYNKVRGKR